MKSAHIRPKTGTFTNTTRLEEAVLAYVEPRLAHDKPLIVGIAGGSASGKTTVAANINRQLGDQHAVLFSQDLFQFGSEFVGHKTSLYKWDDPKNFDLESNQLALNNLRASRSASVPSFDLLTNNRRGTTLIDPRKVIVWEGIYALLTPEIRSVIDLKVFIDAPYVLRLLRRISRFLSRDSIDDIGVPVRHMLTFVLSADKDFVSPQKNYADLVVEVEPDDIDSEISLLVHRAARHSSLMVPPAPDETPVRTAEYAGLKIMLYATTFTILTGNSQILYSTKLDPGIALRGIAAWKYIVHKQSSTNG